SPSRAASTAGSASPPKLFNRNAAARRVSASSGSRLTMMRVTASPDGETPACETSTGVAVACVAGRAAGPATCADAEAALISNQHAMTRKLRDMESLGEAPAKQ